MDSQHEQHYDQHDQQEDEKETTALEMVISLPRLRKTRAMTNDASNESNLWSYSK